MTAQHADEQQAPQQSELPMILDVVEVRSVERISQSFVRVELGGDGLDGVGVDSGLLDQRFKLIFPNAAGRLPQLAADESWYEGWLAIPEDERGSMRTYTIRDVVGVGADTRMVVDIVVHEPGEHSGPGNDWALHAREGDRVIAIAPRRGNHFGGIEFAPGSASRLLIVGDETAEPAVYGILRDLRDEGSAVRGCALLEVPTPDDVLDDVVGPDGIDVVWLPRDGAPRGDRLREAALRQLEEHPDLAAAVATDDEVDPDLWETPAYSSSGEDVEPAAGEVLGAEGPYPGLYAWIAGESKLVTGLRRHLVKDLGVDRSQVAFMGYWREGVAMRG